jgi:hypothetical protein
MSIDGSIEEETEQGPRLFDTDRFEFRTDHSGNEIVIRPREFLAEVGDRGENRIVEVVQEIIQEIIVDRDYGVSEDQPLELQDCEGAAVPNLGRWQRFRLDARFNEINLDVIRIIRGLRERGIPAQPNHVYFTSTRPRNQSTVNPNLFAPNLFAPNLFAPNLFAPNLFAPNLFAPNLFAGGAGGGLGGCHRRGLSQSENRLVPRLAVQPLGDDGPSMLPSSPPPPEGGPVEIHIIDVIALDYQTMPANGTGEITDSVFPDPVDDGPRDPDGPVRPDGYVDPAAGHGDFIKSIIELNSGLTATLWSAADPMGSIDDAALITALKDVDQAADASAHKVLNLSLSGYNEDDRPGVLLADQIKHMIEQRGWIIVASAGNNASCRLAWPAALPGVVAVGALARQCQPAWFSNYGPWVDASALGVDVVANYPALPQTPERKVRDAVDGEEPVTTADFEADQPATWSGTSFAAPLVAARLARALYEGTVADPNFGTEQALEQVLDDEDLTRLPYFGTVVE